MPAQGSRADPVDTANLQSQILSLGERMEAGFRRIEEKIDSFEQRVRTVEQTEAGCQPIVNMRLEAAWQKINEHQAEIDKLTEMVTELRSTNRILTWVGGVLGSAIILWLIGQLLGLIK